MTWVAAVWEPDATVIAEVGAGVIARRPVDDQGPYANAAQFDAFVVGERPGEYEEFRSSAASARVWAWRVTEHVPKLGAQPCAVAMVSLMRRHPGLSHTEFAGHWTQRHGPLALRRHVGLHDYRQYVVDETLTPDTPEIDGIAVLGFAARADFDDRFFDSDAGRAEIMEDVARFMDRPGSETTLVGPAASTRTSRDAR